MYTCSILLRLFSSMLYFFSTIKLFNWILTNTPINLSMEKYGREICLPKILSLLDNVDLYILLCINLTHPNFLHISASLFSRQAF